MSLTSAPGTEQVTFDDIRRAAARIAPIAGRTPVMTSRSFDRESGVQAFFKCENLQRGGAFKIRGAANFVFSIPKPDLARGVVAFSSGNHAQAVAIAAKEVGTRAMLVMPADAPKSKVAATRANGAEIITYDRLREDREAIGAKIAADTGATLVPPYDHPWTMAGQGTTALELLAEVSELDALVVCIGGGGLIAGCAIAAKALAPGIRIFGVEPELANDTWLSLQRGERVGIEPPETIADGLRSPKPGALTFPIVQRLVESVVLVSEEEIKATVRFLLSRMKILVEPSGAVAAAAVLLRKLPPEIRRAGVILSGGNVDADLLASILSEGAPGS
jgi:threonine dehydratase